MPRETIPLLPDANGNDDDNDERGVGRIDAASDSSSASGGDSSSVRIDDGNTRQSVEGNRIVEGNDSDGDDDLPLGDGGYKRPRKSGTDEGGELRIGRERRTRRSRRSRTDSDSVSDSGKTESETASSSSGIPREVALDTLGKPKKEKYTPNTNLSSEFIAEGFGLLFSAAALVLQDDEWKLPEDDAKELAERTKRWARQGSKSIAAFEKRLAKWEPLIMLIFGLFAVVLPRVIHTRDKRRALRIPQKAGTNAANNGNGNGRTASASAQESASRDAVGSSEGRGRDSGENSEPVNARELPFRRQDWREIPGLDER